MHVRVERCSPELRVTRRLRLCRAIGKGPRNMEFVSVNTGLPREVMWHGRSVPRRSTSNRSKAALLCASSIWTETVRRTSASTAAKIKLSTVTRLHTTTIGRESCPDRELPMAIFGENFTTDGLLEDSVHLGDQFSVGSAEVVVTQPSPPLLQTLTLYCGLETPGREC